jgi:hypothetical protein
MPAPFNPASIDAFASVSQGICVRRPTAIVPASGASQTLFRNTGPVLITGFWGIVTAAADANAELLRFFIGASGTTDVSGLTTTVAVAVLNSIITITGVFATVPVITLPTVPTTHASVGRNTPLINAILWPGVGGLVFGVAGTVATNLTLSVNWNLTYVPLDPSAVVLAA